ncbi:hypothetical protein [Alysiella crassa]|nr:hypothetical protein [Alysiella crassa]UOP06617.1 hypothetical protein LVJ80_12860 [Alysiella crassa]
MAKHRVEFLQTWSPRPTLFGRMLVGLQVEQQRKLCVLGSNPNAVLV